MGGSGRREAVSPGTGGNAAFPPLVVPSPERSEHHSVIVT
ncbi:hypothetical protein BU14_0081s0021 [Porphyra umbilicalis]|uniref:Uncharacterized protein n=1 Tax=Porphyra umbilicalis TaxID=2786 RepID=A0A1X6PER2_PORUM|nr:hypothetical protein BU14_0081s0021 [Porphyra umbilicalis]|eukprot:OSX79342.1 hypothetical protein BU14_0081s0021 [Porphyra umbilicalis]